MPGGTFAAGFTTREKGTRTMKNYTRCTVRGHAVEFKVNAGSGFVSVGVDGWLVGNYATAEQAICQAMETVRMIESELTAPTMPAKARRAVAELQGADC